MFLKQKHRKTLLSDTYVEDENTIITSLNEILKSTNIFEISQIDEKVSQSNLIKSDKINSQLFSTLSIIEENKVALKNYQYQISKDLNEIIENYSKDSIFWSSLK